jgi:acylphosphatase
MFCFIDTEFTDFKNCDLLSLGAVSEDGKHEFYVEINDYTPEYRSQFVLDNVMPLMDSAKFGKSYNAAALGLAAWVNSLPDSEIIVVVDYHKDAMFFREMLQRCPQVAKQVSYYYITPAFINMLHERGISKSPEEELKAMRAMVEGTLEYFTIDPRQHHALVDAKANLCGWNKGYDFAKS